MIKYVGILLVFFSCTYTGYLTYLSRYRRLKRIMGMLSLIKFIKQRAEFFSDPLCDIYASFQNEELSKSGYLNTLVQNDFLYAFNEHSKDFGFSEQTDAFIVSFAQTLGKLPLKEQISSCEYLIGIISDEEKNSQVSLEKEKKLFCGIGVLAGCAAVILLV